MLCYPFKVLCYPFFPFDSALFLKYSQKVSIQNPFLPLIPSANPLRDIILFHIPSAIPLIQPQKYAFKSHWHNISALPHIPSANPLRAPLPRKVNCSIPLFGPPHSPFPVPTQASLAFPCPFSPFSPVRLARILTDSCHRWEVPIGTSHR